MKQQASEDEMVKYLEGILDTGYKLKSGDKRNRKVKEDLMESKRDLTDLLDKSYQDAFGIKK